MYYTTSQLDYFPFLCNADIDSSFVPLSHYSNSIHSMSGKNLSHILISTALTSSRVCCFLGCRKLNLCFQGLEPGPSGIPGAPPPVPAPGSAENIVSGSRVALVAFSLLLLFMPPLTRSMMSVRVSAGHSSSSQLKLES